MSATALREKVLNVSRWMVLAVFLVAGCFLYRGMLTWLIGRVTDPAEDMPLVWLSLSFFLFAVWTQRGNIRNVAGTPSWRGAGWICCFLAMAWFGMRGGGHMCLQQVSLIGLIWAVPYALWGKGVGQIILFPAWFLLFTVPVSSSLEGFILSLRTFAAWATTGILSGFGQDIGHSGTTIFSKTPGHEIRMIVADPCSGIRAIFSLMMFTFIYAYFFVKAKLNCWILFACSILVAILGNLLRIFSICLVALSYGQDVAMGFCHTYSGYVTFLLSMLMMQVVVTYIERVGVSRRGSLGQAEVGGEEGEERKGVPAVEPGEDLALMGEKIAREIIDGVNPADAEGAKDRRDQHNDSPRHPPQRRGRHSLETQDVSPKDKQG
ncbi:MAG: exosortase/archaeosortase family protein [Kiritimatiellaeota bacterium]|nr:exosortase/archaeosortase family protein [Kiritimatiellota bacterium]